MRLLSLDCEREPQGLTAPHRLLDHHEGRLSVGAEPAFFISHPRLAGGQAPGLHRSDHTAPHGRLVIARR